MNDGTTEAASAVTNQKLDAVISSLQSLTAAIAANSQPLPTRERPALSEIDQRAIAAATAANIARPAEISSGKIKTVEEVALDNETLEGRVEIIEAILFHLLGVFNRGLDIPALVKQHRENIAGSDLLDATAIGRK